MTRGDAVDRRVRCPALHAFLEAQDRGRTNHGKFSLVQYIAAHREYPSAIASAPLLASLPPVRRFDGPISHTAIWLLDLQTQEGLMFDPALDDAALRRRFLVHPLHVCLLYFPVMRELARRCRETPETWWWDLPALVTLDLDDVLAQPGVLLDRHGAPVRGYAEWSRRGPLAMRLRNREVPIEEDGQADVHPEELAAAGGPLTRRPEW